MTAGSSTDALADAVRLVSRRLHAMAQPGVRFHRGGLEAAVGVWIRATLRGGRLRVDADRWPPGSWRVTVRWIFGSNVLGCALAFEEYPDPARA